MDNAVQVSFHNVDKLQVAGHDPLKCENRYLKDGSTAVLPYTGAGRTRTEIYPQIRPAVPMCNVVIDGLAFALCGHARVDPGNGLGEG